MPLVHWKGERLYTGPLKTNASEHIQHHLRPLAHPDARNTHKIAPPALCIAYIHTIAALAQLSLTTTAGTSFRGYRNLHPQRLQLDIPRHASSYHRLSNVKTSRHTPCCLQFPT